jgi:hypothetical protein
LYVVLIMGGVSHALYSQAHITSRVAVLRREIPTLFFFGKMVIILLDSLLNLMLLLDNELLAA